MTLAVHVTQYWGDNAIAHRTARIESALSFGDEGADFCVPGYVCSELPRSGELAVGDFVFRIEVATREEKPRRSFSALFWDVATFGGSALLHAAVFAAFAMLWRNHDDDNRDRIERLARYADVGVGAERAEAPAMAPEATLTTLEHVSTGVARSNEASVLLWSRGEALAEAADFGFITLIHDTTQAPAVPWASVEEDSLGKYWGSIDGESSLQLSHAEGGGRADVILGGVNVPSIEGAATGHGHLSGTHNAGWRCTLTFCPLAVRGHLLPEVIQRIVRANQTRFVGCYAQGVHRNPSLTGRVSVRFFIARDGSVAQAHETGDSDLPDAHVRTCVVRAFEDISFPEPAGGVVDVTYPLMFTPE